MALEAFEASVNQAAEDIAKKLKPAAVVVIAMDQTGAWICRSNAAHPVALGLLDLAKEVVLETAMKDRVGQKPK